MITPPDDTSSPTPTSSPTGASGRMEWGFSTLGCPDLHLADACALARAHGMAHLELRMLGGSLDLPAYLAEFFPEAGSARRLVEEQGLWICGLGTSFKLINSQPADREELLAFARVADELGAPYLRVFAGGSWGDPLDDARLGAALESIAWWRAARKEHGIQAEILQETHDSFSSSEPCLTLNSHLEEPLMLLWDTHHTWRLAGEDPLVTWEKLRPFVRHLHVKDSVTQPNDNDPKAYTYVLPGEGEMAVLPMLQRILADGYQGAVSLEWEKKWHPHLPPLEDALAAMERAGWVKCR